MTLTLAFRYLRGRGTRSLLTTLAVVFGVMLSFGLNGILPAMMDAFTHSLLAAAGKVDLTVTSAYNQPFRPDVVDRLLTVPQVVSASPGVQRTVPLSRSADAPADALAQVIVVGIDPGSAGTVHDFPVASGRMLANGDDSALVLNADLAVDLHLAVGDQLVLPAAGGTARFRVIGLLNTATVPGQELVYLTLPAAQQLFGLGARITQVEAAFAPGADRPAAEKAVAVALGPNFQVGGLSTESTLLASLQVATSAFTMFGIFALATAGFIIANSFRTVVAERRRDIGMLRAIGARRRTVVNLFLTESLIQGVVGTTLGLAAGWLLAAGMFAVMSPIFESVMHFRVGGPKFTPSTWVTSILLGIGVTVVAAIIPARAAGRVTPLEAMRPQLGEVYRRRVGTRCMAGGGLIVLSLFGLTAGSSSLVGLGSVLFLVGIALIAPVVVNPIADWASQPLELVVLPGGRAGPQQPAAQPGTQRHHRHRHDARPSLDRGRDQRGHIDLRRLHQLPGQVAQRRLPADPAVHRSRPGQCGGRPPAVRRRPRGSRDRPRVDTAAGPGKFSGRRRPGDRHRPRQLSQGRGLRLEPRVDGCCRRSDAHRAVADR